MQARRSDKGHDKCIDIGTPLNIGHDKCIRYMHAAPAKVMIKGLDVGTPLQKGHDKCLALSNSSTYFKINAVYILKDA